MDDATPNAALVIGTLDGRRIEVDFMASVLGVEGRRISNNHVMIVASVPSRQHVIRVLLLHPLDCLRSRLANINILGRLDEHSIRQAQAAIRFVQADRYSMPSSRETWRAALPFTAFAVIEMIARIVLNESLRLAKIVPLVTLNSARQLFSRHLKRLRRISHGSTPPHRGQVPPSGHLVLQNSRYAASSDMRKTLANGKVRHSFDLRKCWTMAQHPAVSSHSG